MSALPAAVQKQIDKANELAAQIYPKDPKGEEGAPADAPVPAAEAPPPAASAPPAVVPPPPAPVVAKLPDSDWEQKYKVLQGKYNAEVPRLQSQAREQQTLIAGLQSQVTGTQALLASLNQGPARAPAAQDGVPLSAVHKLVKDEEVAEYGADLVDLMRRVATETVGPQIDRRLQPVTQQVEKSMKAADAAAKGAVEIAQEKVHVLLDSQVPNWLELNKDENFLAWLDQVDPYAGVNRGALLQQAYNRHDGPRVVAFFKGFLNENATVMPPALPTSVPETPAKNLEDLVAPGTVRAGSTAGAQDGASKRNWTRADIAKFYRDKSDGKYDKAQKRAEALEEDIFAAQREGRIR